jgi:hypothetical protein
MTAEPGVPSTKAEILAPSTNLDPSAPWKLISPSESPPLAELTIALDPTAGPLDLAKIKCGPSPVDVVFEVKEAQLFL